MFKVTARDQGHYKGPSGHLLHTVTFLGNRVIRAFTGSDYSELMTRGMTLILQQFFFSNIYFHIS